MRAFLISVMVAVLVASGCTRYYSKHGASAEDVQSAFESCKGGGDVARRTPSTAAAAYDQAPSMGSYNQAGRASMRAGSDALSRAAGSAVDLDDCMARQGFTRH